MITINSALELIKFEKNRQANTISLIASENVASKNVLAALGSGLSDKYAEGYPGRRYYSGCKIIDMIESSAINTACELFGSKYANVQPHSGSQANEAIFSAFLLPGDRVLGLSLNHGGHLTHGFKSNNSGKLYQCQFYEAPNGIINMKDVLRIAKEFKPKLIIAGASSYSRQIDWAGFRQICNEVGSLYLADIAHYAGLIAGKVYPSPVQYADVVTMTTHKVLRGPRGGAILWNKDEYTPLINRAVFPGIQGGPMMHSIAAKCIAFAEATTNEYRSYVNQVIANSRTLCEALKQKKWQILSDGTDCHMFVADLRQFEIDGLKAQQILEANGITSSSSRLPSDTNKDSGIRFGTAAITSRGANENDMELLADLINDIVCFGKNRADCVTKMAHRLDIK